MRDTLSHAYRNGITAPGNNSDTACTAETAKEWDEIQWEVPDLRNDVKEARISVAADLHYLYMTHLTIVGEIVGEDPDIEMKRLAAVLTDDRMRNVDAWSNYITTVQENADVTSEMSGHSDDLLAEDSLCQLSSIALGDVFIATLYQHMEDDTSLFHRVLQRDVRQARRNIEIVIDHLQQGQGSLPADRQDAVAARISSCLRWSEVYVDRYGDILETAGVDAEQFIASFRRNARQFCERICPEEPREA